MPIFSISIDIKQLIVLKKILSMIGLNVYTHINLKILEDLLINTVIGQMTVRASYKTRKMDVH